MVGRLSENPSPKVDDSKTLKYQQNSQLVEIAVSLRVFGVGTADFRFWGGRTNPLRIAAQMVTTCYKKL